MERMMLTVAVLPVFGLLLSLISKVPARLGGRIGHDRIAPLLYATVLATATVIATIAVRAAPAQLGLAVPDVAGAGPFVSVPAAVLAGLAGGIGVYFGELWFAGRARSTAGVAGSSSSAAESAGMRAVRVWLPSRVAFLVLGVLIALFEELLWRGFLLTGLRTDLGIGLALIVQATGFGAVHLPFGRRAAAAKAVGGLAWGALSVGFGTVLVSLLAHLVFQGLVTRRLWRGTPARGGEVGHAAHDVHAV